MVFIKYRTQLSDNEALLELESLKASLGWHYIHNFLVDEIDRMGETILDDLVDKKLDPDERHELEVQRYLYKRLLQLPDKMQDNLRTSKDQTVEGEDPLYDPYDK